MALLQLGDAGIGGRIDAVLRSLSVEAVQPGNIRDSTGSVGSPGQVLIIQNGKMVWSDVIRDLQAMVAAMDSYLRAINDAMEIQGATYP